MLEFLVDKFSVVFAGKVFQQIISIPMDTNCAPFLADIFLYSCEAAFIQSLLSTGRKRLAFQFNFTYRYIDDVLSINNPDFENYLGQMYPPELEIKDTTVSNTSASSLDLLLSIDRDGQLHTSLYDKRDDLISILQTSRSWAATSHLRPPIYVVFISQLIRYARASSSYECFILRAMRLSNKLLGQRYVKERLRSSLRKFYGRHGDLIKQYEVLLSQMLHDILDDDLYSDTLYWSGITPIFYPITFCLIARGFHRTFATGEACQQRTLAPPGAWSCLTLGLAGVLMLRLISPELVLFPDFWVSNIPRYLFLLFVSATTRIYTEGKWITVNNYHVTKLEQNHLWWAYLRLYWVGWAWGYLWPTFVKYIVEHISRSGTSAQVSDIRPMTPFFAYLILLSAIRTPPPPERNSGSAPEWSMKVIVIVLGFFMLYTDNLAALRKECFYWIENELNANQSRKITLYGSVLCSWNCTR